MTILKLNRNYCSLFTLLCADEVLMDVKQPFDFGYGELFADGTRGRNEYLLKDDIILKPIGIDYKRHLHANGRCIFNELMGTFTPFRKMYKDLSDTVQPYFTEKKIKKDLLQPFIGLVNVADGLLSILISLVAIVFFILYFPCCYSQCHANARLDYMGQAASCLIYGVANIIRGITQVVSTPLTYFIKIPLRVMITFFHKRYHTLTTIEKKPEIQRLAIKAQQHLSLIEQEQAKFRDYPYRNVDIVMRLLYEIHRKFKRSHRDGWNTRVDDFAAFDDLFKEIFNTYYETIELKLAKEVKVEPLLQQPSPVLQIVGTVPAQLCCPISGEIMNQPVRANDGLNYEQRSIIPFIDQGQPSPITGLIITDIKENRKLKTTIENYIMHHSMNEDDAITSTRQRSGSGLFEQPTPSKPFPKKENNISLDEKEIDCAKVYTYLKFYLA